MFPKSHSKSVEKTRKKNLVSCSGPPYTDLYLAVPKI